MVAWPLRLLPRQRTLQGPRLMSPMSQTEVATTRLPGSNWANARAYLCNGDATDREQPIDHQLRRHAISKEQHARNQGEHWKQQAEGSDAAHGATPDQPEPKAKAD